MQRLLAGRQLGDTRHRLEFPGHDPCSDQYHCHDWRLGGRAGVGPQRRRHPRHQHDHEADLRYDQRHHDHDKLRCDNHHQRRSHDHDHNIGRNNDKRRSDNHDKQHTGGNNDARCDHDHSDGRDSVSVSDHCDDTGAHPDLGGNPHNARAGWHPYHACFCVGRDDTDGCARVGHAYEGDTDHDTRHDGEFNRADDHRGGRREFAANRKRPTGSRPRGACRLSDVVGIPKTVTLRTRASLRALAMLVLFSSSAMGATPVAAPTTPIVAAVKATQQVAKLLNAHEAFAEPARDSVSLGLVPAQRPLTGESTVLPVLGDSIGSDGIGWLHVMLPGRPNEHTGWIRSSATIRTTTSWHIVVDTKARSVIVYQNGRPVRRVKAVVGKPSTPTPRGEFFVEEAILLRKTDPGAPFALALSARSEVLQEFDGGPGQIGLHGLSNIGGVLGSAVSHGCVRLDKATMRWLVLRIGPGVPVTITT